MNSRSMLGGSRGTFASRDDRRQGGTGGRDPEVSSRDLFSGATSRRSPRRRTPPRSPSRKRKRSRSASRSKKRSGNKGGKTTFLSLLKPDPSTEHGNAEHSISDNPLFRGAR